MYLWWVYQGERFKIFKCIVGMYFWRVYQRERFKTLKRICCMVCMVSMVLSMLQPDIVHGANVILSCFTMEIEVLSERWGPAHKHSRLTRETLTDMHRRTNTHSSERHTHTHTHSRGTRTHTRQRDRHQTDRTHSITDRRTDRRTQMERQKDKDTLKKPRNRHTET